MPTRRWFFGLGGGGRRGWQITTRKLAWGKDRLVDATRDELRRLPAELRRLRQEDREDRTERPAFVPASHLVLNPMSVWVRLCKTC